LGTGDIDILVAALAEREPHEPAWAALRATIISEPPHPLSLPSGGAQPPALKVSGATCELHLVGSV